MQTKVEEDDYEDRTPENYREKADGTGRRKGQGKELRRGTDYHHHQHRAQMLGGSLGRDRKMFSKEVSRPTML